MIIGYYRFIYLLDIVIFIFWVVLGVNVVVLCRLFIFLQLGLDADEVSFHT
jgi:hypothetical protein